VTQILILAGCVYTSILAAAVYFSRATTRRVVGALAGGVAVALVGPGVEAFAHARGWWRYPHDDTPVGPLAMYPVLVVMMAFLALFGWVVMRRFGWRGLIVFLGVLAVVGALRDYFISGKLMGLIVFAPGILLVVIDAALWAGLTALAIGVMRLVSGPARDDRLARRRGDSA
jgi:hypothetical protein